MNKMNIAKNEKNLKTATEIIRFLNGLEPGRKEPVLSIQNGDLLFYNRACGIDESETVILDRVEGDSFGDGWINAQPAEIIDYLNDNFNN